MSEKRPMPCDRPSGWFVKELNSDLFGQIPAAPPVVVSPDQGQRDSGVNDLFQLGQQVAVSTRGAGSVLEPEVEQVSVNDNGRRFNRCVVQPVEKRSLVGGWSCPGMDIRGQKDGLGFRHARK